MSASLQKPKFPFTSASSAAPPVNTQTDSAPRFRDELVWDLMAIVFPMVLALLGVAVALFPPLDDTIRLGWIAIFVILAIAALLASQGQREIYRLNSRRHEAVKNLRP